MQERESLEARLEAALEAPAATERGVAAALVAVEEADKERRLRTVLAEKAALEQEAAALREDANLMAAHLLQLRQAVHVCSERAAAAEQQAVAAEGAATAAEVLRRATCSATVPAAPVLASDCRART